MGVKGGCSLPLGRLWELRRSKAPVVMKVLLVLHVGSDDLGRIVFAQCGSPVAEYVLLAIAS